MKNQLPNGLLCDVALPYDKKLNLGGKDIVSLTLRVIWVTFYVFMDILLAVYETFFPHPGKSLAGKVVLVTGSGRGLGRGLAIGFFKEGCKIAVVDINMNNAVNTAAEITSAGGVAKAYQCNVANPDDIRVMKKRVMSDLGHVDILVNNAGIIYGGDKLEDCQEADIRAVVEVNFLSHFWMMREFILTMRAHNRGHIVAIASLGSFAAGETGSAYIASKFGVRGLMEVVRLELESSNIHTTTVYPYFINTSADYVDRWKISVPPISIDEAVEATISGVKRNSISVFIPSYSELVVKLIGLLPRKSYDRYKRIFFYKVLPQTKNDEIDIEPSKVNNGLNKK